MKLSPLTSLPEIRSILVRREKQALDVAERAPLPTIKQASLDEAAFFAGLRLLVSEVEVARAINGEGSIPWGIDDESLPRRHLTSEERSEITSGLMDILRTTEAA